MHNALHATIDIFADLFERVHRYIPEDLREEMGEALQELSHDNTLSLRDIEDIVIAFGKKVWPYRKAFDDILHVYEGHVGEDIFLGLLPQAMQRKYQLFAARGGSLRDLHVGSPAQFFSVEERQKLCEALVDLGLDLRAYTLQKVHTSDTARFEQKAEEYAHILFEIEEQLAALKIMAETEQEHPHLAEEIRASIRAFEEGLCLLGPNTSHAAVCAALPHFVGRRIDLSIRMKHRG